MIYILTINNLMWGECWDLGELKSNFIKPVKPQLNYHGIIPIKTNGPHKSTLFIVW